MEVVIEKFPSETLDARGFAPIAGAGESYVNKEIAVAQCF